MHEPTLSRGGGRTDPNDCVAVHWPSGYTTLTRAADPAFAENTLGFDDVAVLAQNIAMELTPPPLAPEMDWPMHVDSLVAWVRHPLEQMLSLHKLVCTAKERPWRGTCWYCPPCRCPRAASSPRRAQFGCTRRPNTPAPCSCCLRARRTESCSNEWHGAVDASNAVIGGKGGVRASVAGLVARAKGALGGHHRRR